MTSVVKRKTSTVVLEGFQTVLDGAISRWSRQCPNCSQSRIKSFNDWEKPGAPTNVTGESAIWILCQLQQGGKRKLSRIVTGDCKIQPNSTLPVAYAPFLA